MKVLFGTGRNTKRTGKTGWVCAMMLLALLLVMAGCKQQPADSGRSDTESDNPAVEDNVNAPGGAEDLDEDTASASDETDGQESEASTSRIENLEQTEPQVHVDLKELAFEENVVPENYYYRSATDETGMACYEIQPADSDEPVFLPMASTVVYMTNPEAPNADQAYYEQTTLTYTLDGEPVESVQYQIYVPNVLEPVGDAVIGGDGAAVDGSGQAG